MGLILWILSSNESALTGFLAVVGPLSGVLLAFLTRAKYTWFPSSKVFGLFIVSSIVYSFFLVKNWEYLKKYSLLEVKDLKVLLQQKKMPRFVAYDAHNIDSLKYIGSYDTEYDYATQRYWYTFLFPTPHKTVFIYAKSTESSKTPLSIPRWDEDGFTFPIGKMQAQTFKQIIHCTYFEVVDINKLPDTALYGTFSGRVLLSPIDWNVKAWRNFWRLGLVLVVAIVNFVVLFNAPKKFSKKH